MRSTKRSRTSPRRTPTSTSDRARFARGLTLLELIIAIALVLALAAIALPALTATLAEREFEAAAETVRGHLLLARAHARTSRRAVVVHYRASPPRLEARWFDPDLEADLRDAREPDAKTRDPLRLLESWAHRPLPESVRVSRTAPPDAGAGADPLPSWAIAPDPAVDGADDALEPRSLRLAVFLPDGSALAGEPFWLIGGKGRHGSLEINPWTGMVIFSRSSGAVAEDAAPEDEDDDEPEEDPDEDAFETRDEPDEGPFAPGDVEERAADESTEPPAPNAPATRPAGSGSGGPP